MVDSYQIVALLLTALLLPGFGHLYLRFRDIRTLLWFLGFLFALLRMAQSYQLGIWDVHGLHPWLSAVGEVSIQVSAAFFLASLSPLRFKIGRYEILYVVPYALPLVIYAILWDGVFRDQAPNGPLFLVFPLLGAMSLVVATFWGVSKGTMPISLSLPACLLLGCFGIWGCYLLGPGWSLTLVECANHFMTALLVITVFRRLSPGVFLTVLGFTAWALSALLTLPIVEGNADLNSNLTRAIYLGKVVAALGMILLALEDQLAINETAKTRERRARLELEAYTNLLLSRRRVEDFDRQAEEICHTIAKHSRFSKTALLLRSAGRFRLAGSAGIGAAVNAAMDSLAARLPGDGFLAPGSAPPAVDHSQTMRLSLEPWMIPGDDLRRLGLTETLAVPMVGRSATEGALLLTGLRQPREPLRADDLLPIEMLTARLQSVRGQTMMLEKLIDSENFAGLGQLAGNVSQQLNNPLTVILGYASLVEENPHLDAQERRGIEAILSEARRMRSTLQSLTRFAQSKGDPQAAVSVQELLADLEELHRTEFLHRSIEFRINIAPGLPRVLCQAQQLRQAVLHCLQFAMDAVDQPGAARGEARPEERTVRIDATSEAGHVQILIAHSGAAFAQPDRAFDPFVQPQAAGEPAGLGLSLCATILRDNNGRAYAVNLEPRGAAIILELQAA